MIKIYPFPALRASSEYADKVSSMSTGIEGNEELIKELESNPFSYLHIVKPHLHFSDGVSNGKKHYPYAKNYFRQMIEGGIINRIPKNALYIYTQITPEGYEFDGIITGISFLNYLEGEIKKHENTLAEKEERLMNHVVSLGAVAEPVLLACEDSEEFSSWISKNKETPVFDFTMKDNHRHVLYEILEDDKVKAIQGIFERFDKLYIADGHHRIAATTSYCTRLFTTQNKAVEDLLFMAYIIPESNLKIKSFHRLVSNVKESDIDKILSNPTTYAITESNEPVIPSCKGEMGMFYKSKWYLINLEPQTGLDVQFLDSEIFNKKLGIIDTRIDTRIEYLRGDTPLMSLEVSVKKGESQIAFTLFPNTMEEIKTIADNHQTMPPKSTWIEPKLPVGMVIQRF